MFIIYIYIYVYIYIDIITLVGGLEHVLFSIYWEQYSQLTFIFFRGVGIPPTRYIYIYVNYMVFVYAGYCGINPTGQTPLGDDFSPTH